jgi:hypothetical protein
LWWIEIEPFVKNGAAMAIELPGAKPVWSGQAQGFSTVVWRGRTDRAEETGSGAVMRV